MRTRRSASGLKTLATLPLGPNRSMQLVRAGNEVVLVGVGEAGVTPIRTYGEHEARALGLLATRTPPRSPGRHASGCPRRRVASRPPAASRRSPAQADGDQVKADGQNAVQLLLLIGGISLVPALLFTVTGFTRILIVLGFIRSGLGTPTAPPNQVLVGIALFLTMFVMAPTFTKIKDDAIDPLQKGKITQEVAFKRAEAPMREFMFDQTRSKDLALFAKLGKRRAARRRARTSRPTS